MMAALLGTPLLAGAHLPMNGEWKTHHAFDAQTRLFLLANHVERIMDGERFVYYWANQTPYGDRDQDEPYNKSLTTLWCVDKQSIGPDGEFEVRHVDDVFGINAGNVDFAEYNVRGGYLVCVYTDGSLDVLYDDGSAVHGDGISGRPVPGSLSVSSITFDTERQAAYLATRFGFLVLDPATATVTGRCELATPVSSVTRVGDLWVLALDDTLYTAPVAAGLPASADDLCPLATDGEGFPAWITGSDSREPWQAYTPGRVPMPAAIWPVSEDGFYVLIPNLAMADGSVSTAHPTSYVVMLMGRPAEGDEWHSTYYGTAFMAGRNQNSFNHENAVTSSAMTARGFQLTGQQYVYDWVSEGLTYDREKKTWSPYPLSNKELAYNLPEGTTANVATYMAPGYDRTRRVASYDGVTFWMYQPWEGVYRRDYSADDKSWGEISERRLPNAPVVALAGWMAWHPDYGMLVRNPGVTRRFSNAKRLGDKLSGYKDGKWTVYSADMRVPVEFGAAQTSAMPGLIDQPYGIAVDPSDQSVVWSGSMYDGLTRLNMKDPLKTRVFTHNGTIYPEAEMTLKVFRNDPGYKDYCFASDPAFDVNGVMWFVKGDFSDMTSAVHVMYWRPEDRLAVDSESDFAAHAPGELVIAGYPVWNDAKVLPLRSPGNETRLLIWSGADEKFCVYDHKGTLDDTSDDTWYPLAYRSDDHGGYLTAPRTYSMVEDETCGRIWLPTTDGLFWLDLARMDAHPSVVNHLTVTGKGMDENTECPLDGVPATSLCIDTAGRKWVGTTLGGIYCFSDDAERMVAHLTTHNSGLVSDDVLCVGWNPATASLMISTMAGLCEFSPSTDLEEIDPDLAYAWPCDVMPGYEGYVTVEGMPRGTVLTVVNEQGETVATLPAATGSRTQWLPGNVPAGRYMILDAKGGVVDTVNIIR